MNLATGVRMDAAGSDVLTRSQGQCPASVEARPMHGPCGVGQQEIRVGAWVGLEKLRPRLQRYLLARTRSESEVDDIIQETFLRAARYRSHLKQDGNLLAWVIRIAANVTRDSARGCRRYTTGCIEEIIDEGHAGTAYYEDDESEAVLLSVGEERIDRELLQRHLSSALRSLQPRDRELVRSFYDGGKCCQEAGRSVGLSKNLAKVRLFRARRELARCIQRRVREANIRDETGAHMRLL